MHRTMWTLLICLLLLSAASVSAQQDENDEGEMDSVLVDFPVFPDVATGEDNLQMDLYFFNDVQGLGAVSMGFDWINANMTMDSAVVTTLADDSWDFFTYLYRNNILDSTNFYQEFQFGAARIQGSGLLPGASRKMVCSYYFTLSDWTVNDSIVIDTTRFSSGTYLKFNDLTNTPYVPYWAGKRVLRDTSFVAPSNLVVSPDTLYFSGIEGGADPPSQQFDVDSDFDPLTFNLVESASWLAPTPTGGTTPQTITVSVTTLSLTEGTYFDSIQVVSAGAVNSPQYVYCELEVTPPPPVIGVSDNFFNFVAQEGGANPASQTLTVFNDGSQTLSWNVSNSQTWLDLSPTSGFETGDVTLSVDITGLLFGTYRDTIVVTALDAPNSPVRIPVELVVGTDLPMIDVDSVIYWPVPTSELPVFFRSFEVRNGGEGEMNFWIEESSSIIKEVTPDSSTAPDSIELSLGLLETSVPSGETTFVAQIYSNEAINSPFLVRFRIKLVDSPAIITLSQQNVVFDMYPCYQGYGLEPQSVHIDITNTGGDDPMPIQVLKTSDLYTAYLDELEAPAPNGLTITAKELDWPPGTYYDTIIVQSTWAENTPQEIVVQYNLLEAPNDPVIQLEQTEIVIPWREGGGPVLVDGPGIYNQYPGCMAWQLVELIPWVTPQATSGQVPEQTSLVIDPSGYTLGEYVETMQVVAPDATNSPQDVTMRLQVWRLVGDVNWDGSIDIEDLQRLISYLFNQTIGPQPTWEVGDTDCSGAIDITDVQFLVDNLFISLEPLCTNP